MIHSSSKHAMSCILFVHTVAYQNQGRSTSVVPCHIKFICEIKVSQQWHCDPKCSRPPVQTMRWARDVWDQACCSMLPSSSWLFQSFLPIMRMHCHQVRSHSGSSGCWGFLCITVGSLPYNIKGVEMTDLALYKQNLLNWCPFHHNPVSPASLKLSCL